LTQLPPGAASATDANTLVEVAGSRIEPLTLP